MLKKIFGSGARVKLFKQFLLNQNDEFFIRELTRILDEQINSLRRELENLERIGLLKSKERNRKKYYQINPHFSLLPELTSIIRKTDESNQLLLKNLSKLGDIDLLILNGQFMNNENELDLFLVGTIESSRLEVFLEEMFPKKDIKYGIMTREDFLYRITLKDKFVQTLLADKNSLILKNKLKKDTGVLIKGL
ncbi:hypothetical protein KAI58_00535 [Candidatus Gracilibacteria bacterium]|nr:hypothetical protein [Candidatus Gracilibacteria bacterium]